MSAVAVEQLDVKRRESRVRRILRRSDQRLRKSRQDGLYVVVDAATNFVVWGDPNFGCGLSLEEIEAGVLRFIIREEPTVEEMFVRL